MSNLRPYTMMDQLYFKVGGELAKNAELFPDPCPSSLYLDIATDASIARFLHDTPLYDGSSKMWTGLCSIVFESELFTSLEAIVSSILLGFAAPFSRPGVRRAVQQTEYRPLLHMEREPTELGSTPAFVIKAEGPSFETPGSGSLGYTNVAACFHAQLEETLRWDDLYYAEQSSIFARQMFIQQPNRRFVRNLLLTEKTCRFYHFDRSGVQYTLPFDIHAHPEVFIRLVLGLSSVDEALLGLDTSIQWTIVDGKKTGGTVTVLNAHGDQVVYPLSDRSPAFRRFDLCGRATTGWRATDAEGREVFIKDSWRPYDATPEYTILEAAVGVPGAAQLLAYETREISTWELRAFGISEAASPKKGQNRISTRVVQELYGKSILFFESQRQLLGAVRDAIAAHKTLVNDRDILHRDVSQLNILIGRRGASIGNRGVLVDYDNASLGKRPLDRGPSGPRHGTRSFMSVAVLYSHGPFDPTPNHDQLDDLESFYYVLYDILCSWEGVGALIKERPQVVKDWERISDPIDLATCKRSHYFLDEPDLEWISPYWLPAVRELIVEFYKVVRPLVLAKVNLRTLTDVKKDRLRALVGTADQCYDQVLALFDKAIHALEVEEPASFNDADTSRPSNPAPHPSPSSSKRGSDAPAPERPPQKRRRTAAPPGYTPPVTRARAKAERLQHQLLDGTNITSDPKHPYTPPRTRSKTRAAASQAPQRNAKQTIDTSKRSKTVRGITKRGVRGSTRGGCS